MITPNEPEYSQAIFHRDEIPVADYLMSFQEGLLNDFMRGFKTLKEAQVQTRASLDRRHDGIPLEKTAWMIRQKSKETGEYNVEVNAWRSGPLRYKNPVAGIDWTLASKSFQAARWPTAMKIIEEFGEDCPLANYSCMGPQTILDRHTGIENRSGEFVRIHIPLIIPEGDVFLEVNGEEVRWADGIFAFNNQLPHSAYNYTDEYRLIFLFDLRRSRIGMPPGIPYKKHIEATAGPFIRKPKQS